MTGVGFSGPSPGPSAVAGWRAAKSCLPCARRLATSSHLELKTALGGNSLVHGFRQRGVDRASGRPKVPQPVSEGQGFPADWWSPLPSQRVLQVRLTAPREATVLHPSTLFGDGFCRRWQSLPLECIWFYEDLSCPSGKTKIRAGYHNRKA